MQDYDDSLFTYASPSTELLSPSISVYNRHNNSMSETSFRRHIDGALGAHHTYAYHYPACSPWEAQKFQPHSMIPTSQLRSSVGECSYRREPLSAGVQQHTDMAPFQLENFEEASSAISLADTTYPQRLADTIVGNNLEMPDASCWTPPSTFSHPSPSVSSDTASSPSPPLPSPTIQVQRPLVLHQPRPYRRIPIISLSQLASACDEQKTTTLQPNSLSPLPVDCLDYTIDHLQKRASTAAAHKPSASLYFPPITNNAYKAPTDTNKLNCVQPWPSPSHFTVSIGSNCNAAAGDTDI
ncbi:hypothetical protein AX17_000830 [Amanita inopinata Kibby_2008]|nr:hypothetical protein AX17_000830 [Amanita inopinata Kibby_2008]